MLTFPVYYSTQYKSNSYYIFNFETMSTEIYKIIHANLGIITSNNSMEEFNLKDHHIPFINYTSIVGDNKEPR